ncbi:MAG: type VI secretion system-associated FHA domain protein TagH [Dyella sp.]
MSIVQNLILSVQGNQASRFGAGSQKIFEGRDGSIGRSEECDWTLSTEGVSRLHAMVRYLNGIYFIEDRSTNGMLLNGNPLQRGEPASLRDGDRLQIDTFEVSVQLSGGDETRLQPQPQSMAPVVRHDAWEPAAIVAPIAPAIDDASLIPRGGTPSPALDPLSFLQPASDVWSVPVAPSVNASWNHTPASVDNFQLPSLAPARAQAELLPDNWDLTLSQFAPLPARAPALSPLARVATSVPASALPPLDSVPEPVIFAPEPGLVTATVAEPAPEVPAEPTPMPSMSTPMPTALPTPPAAEPPPPSTDLERAMFRVVIDGMMEVLRARAELKNSFRLPVTIIQRAQNNPLKFAATADEAIGRLLAPPSNAFLSGTAALDDALQDIRHHQMAMLAGVRAAFDGLLAQFDPRHFETDSAAGLRTLFAGKNRPWDRYQEHFAGLMKNPDECFRRLFGEEFARAYEEQLARLAAERTTSSMS